MKAELATHPDGRLTQLEAGVRAQRFDMFVHLGIDWCLRQPECSSMIILAIRTHTANDRNFYAILGCREWQEKIGT